MCGVAAIETERLTKRYDNHRGIEDVTTTVEAGEVFGLLGPNGAGKTTLIRTLLDLLHPTSGSARLFGLDSRRESVAIRARLGNLPGDFSYGPPSLTGREILTLFAQLRKVKGLGNAEQLAERFRADLDRPIGQLSRGNRQKIGLLQALSHDPELARAIATSCSRSSIPSMRPSSRRCRESATSHPETGRSASRPRATSTRSSRPPHATRCVTYSSPTQRSRRSS
jgi:ABC-type transport system involved in cytochrome c biogenesis ATPase subunit